MGAGRADGEDDPVVPPARTRGAEVAVVTDETFMALTEGGWTLVDLSAAWCGPCRTFTPLFRQVAQAHDGPVRFAVCDIDASPGVAALLQVRSVPTVVAFGPDGSEVGRHSGALPRGALEATVEQLRARAVDVG